MAGFAKVATEFVWTLTGTRSESRYDGWGYSFTEESAVNPEYHACQTEASGWDETSWGNSQSYSGSGSFTQGVPIPDTMKEPGSPRKVRLGAA